MTVPWRFSEKKCGVKCSRSRNGISLVARLPSSLSGGENKTKNTGMRCETEVVDPQRGATPNANTARIPSIHELFIFRHLYPRSGARSMPRTNDGLRADLLLSTPPAPNPFLLRSASTQVCVIFFTKACLIPTGEGHRLHPAQGQVEAFQQTGLCISLRSQFRQPSLPHQGSQRTRYTRDNTHDVAHPQWILLLR